MANIDFSRKLKNYSNELVIGTMSNTEWEQDTCLDWDSTLFDRWFWLIVKWTVTNYWSYIYLLNYDKVNWNIKTFEFDEIDSTWAVWWRVSCFAKKWNYIYMFYYDIWTNNYKYYKYTIATTPNSKWVYKLTRVSATATTLFSSWTTSSWIAINQYIIYHSWYFIFWFHIINTWDNTNYIKLTSWTISFDWSWNITSWTYKAFTDYSIVVTTWTIGWYLWNYDNYFVYWCWRTTWAQQINWKIAKLNLVDWTFTSISSTITWLLRIWSWNRITRSKLTQKWKHVRVSLWELKYYNDTYSLVTTWVSCPNWDYYVCPFISPSYTIFKWMVMNESNTWNWSYFVDLDVSLSWGYYYLDDLQNSRLYCLLPLDDDTRMFFSNTNVIQVFTISDWTFWWNSFYSSWNWITNTITVPTWSQFLFYNTVYTLNGWTETIEIRWDWWSWINVTSSKNTKIWIPVWSTTLEFKVTLTSSSWQLNSPITDNLMYWFYK